MRSDSINPGSVQDRLGGGMPAWAHKFVSVAVLAASVAALALIVESQDSQARFDEVLQRPLDAISQAAGGAQHKQQAAALTPAEESRHRALAEYVAKRYRVSQDVAFDLVRVAYRAGAELRLDPLLIIAVMAIESSFNPIAESVAGAKGLMQIIPKYHGDKLEGFGGERAVFDPVTNIQVGAQILKEYIGRTGSVGIGLQMYAGALGDNSDQYTNKVLGMKERLQYVVLEAPAHSAATPAALRTASALNASSFPLQVD